MKNIFLLVMIAMTASLAAQSPTAFTCTGSDGFGYYTSSASSSQTGSTLTYASSRISKLTTSTGARVTLCSSATMGVALNALAFNPHDNFLYAMSRYDASVFSGTLYRIGENCQRLVIPVSGPIVKFTTNNINTIDAAGGNLSSGTFDADNNYYVNTSFTNAASTGFINKLQKIEITGNIATVINTVDMTCPNCTGTKLRVTDIIFDEASGNLLGSNKETNKLYSINPMSGMLTEIGSTGITSPILGIYKNRDGNVRAINETGNIYSVNVTTGVFSFLATSATLNSGNADAASGCYAPPRISGHLYIDANGLTDNTINGIPTDNAGGTIMYANLVQNGVVVKSDIINSTTGLYQFLGLFSGLYEVQMSSTRGTEGLAPPSQNLPNNYLFTGENIGVAAGDDGTPNGEISVNISSGSDVEDVNFGINGLPTSAGAAGPTAPNPGGTIQVQAPSLSIEDPEESGINNITIALIPNPTTMGILYYNGVAVVPNQYISNYIPALLTLDPVDGNVTMAFTYFTTDMAGEMSNVSTVTQEFTSNSLSIELVNFEGQVSDHGVKLLWETASEQNNDHFLLMRSQDGILFESIASILSLNGNSTTSQYYSYIDKDARGKTYYRLTQVDLDGYTSQSDAISIIATVDNSYSIYPTITDGTVHIFKEDRTENISYQVVDQAGQMVVSGIAEGGITDVELDKFPIGVYFVIILDAQFRRVKLQKIIRL